METADRIIQIILYVFAVLVSYQILLRFIGLFFKARKFKETDKQHNFAILIAARNEERVIGNLIESIKKQDYPSDKITIFVVADNCSDKTAQVARDAGAIVYERINPPLKERRKGYALDFLLKNIAKDFAGEGQENGILSFDGYILFDADNLLALNYMTEMNKAFDYKEFDFYSSYMNVKNFDSSFIASYSGITRYSPNCVTRRPLTLLHMSPASIGCGCCIRSHLLENGWEWHGLTEDTEFSYKQIAKGVRSAYVEAAEFFDEQPNKLRILLRQRKRWDKGRATVWCKTFLSNIKGIFVQKGFARKASCYDASISCFPYSVLTLVMGFLYPLVISTYKLASPGGDYSLLTMLQWVGSYYAVFYVQELSAQLCTIIREHNHIRCHPVKLCLRLFFWPFVTLLLQFNALAALFLPVKWKTIPHVENKKIENIYEQKTLLAREEKQESKTPILEPTNILASNSTSAEYWK